MEFWLLFLYIILHVHLLTKESKRKRRLGSVNRKAKDSLTGLILTSHSHSHGIKRASHYTFWHIFPIIWRKLSAMEIIILCKITLKKQKEFAVVIRLITSHWMDVVVEVFVVEHLKITFSWEGKWIEVWVFNCVRA